jgi:hypothetical protein
MTSHDRYDEYPQDTPRLTLAEPLSRRSASRGDREEAAQVPTQPLDTQPESNTTRGERRGRQTDLEAGGTPARPAEDLAHTNDASSDTTLFADDELAGLRARWNDVQAGFVDDPRSCVQKADGLVADMVGQLANGFTEARSRLERQWGRGEEVSTEDLRIALTRYRDFFERLLAV